MKRLPLALFLPFFVFSGCECENPPPPIQPAWGIADLHAHPATHLGFGAKASGGGGMFWGSPGMRWEDAASTLATDLAACSPEKHDGSDGDVVRHETRKQVIDTLNKLTGYSHAAHGHSSDPALSHANWPAAQSVIHQQMHVEFLRRAWEGGVRLMVASVTDNQTLAMLWNVNVDAARDFPQPDVNREFESARRQLDFIRELVRANSSWLAVVTHPDLARIAIAQNKMALILGVEMDSLTSEQLVQLKRTHQVSTVIPIHLVDNSFGGTAVYNDVFNANNGYINRRFFDVVPDANLDFRLGVPEKLTIRRDKFGALVPEAIDRSDYCGLNYEPCPEISGHVGIPFDFGHKNRRGLHEWELRRLMKAGLLVDVAHMSEAATEEALTLAERHGYPLMNSHTGVRLAGARAGSERAMLSTHVQRMAALGGVLGLGTEGNLRERTHYSAGGSGLVRLTGKGPSHTFDLSRPVVTKLVLTVRTGSDGLSGQETGRAVVFLTSGDPVVIELNSGTSFPSGSVRTIDLELPRPVFRHELQSFGLSVSMESPVAVPFWTLDEVRLDAAFQSGSQVTLLHETGTPVVRLGGTGSFLRTLSDGFPPETPLRRLHLAVRTGDDDLRGDNDNAYVHLTLSDRRRFKYDVNRGRALANGSTTNVQLELPDGVRMQDIASLRLATTIDGEDCCVDNWNVDELHLEAEDRSGNRATLARHTGTPYIRFTRQRQEVTFFVGTPEPLPADAPARLLRLTFRTGEDDLREGSVATGTITLADGRTHTFPLNQGAKWPSYSTYHRLVRLPFAAQVQELRSLRVDTDFRGGVDGDNWDIDQLEVQILGDPVEQWVHEYQEVTALMGGRPVALGTDINGFAPQMPLSLASLPDPITVAVDHSAGAPDAVRSGLRPLRRSTLGAKVFDFGVDGIAHYGMLPDFVQAVALQPTGSEPVAKLFQSAETVLQMWDRVLEAQPRVRSDGTTVRRLRFTVNTGGDDLRGGGDKAWAFFNTASGRIELDLNAGDNWPNDSIRTVERELPFAQPMSALTGFGVRTNFGGGCCGDNWNLDGILVEFQREDGSWEVLLERRGFPFRRFTGEYREWTMPL